MVSGLTLDTLLAPITAATVVNAVWFAVIWRGHQHERRQGKMPWQFDLALGSYIATNGLALYLSMHRSLTSGTDVFGAAMAAEAFGIVITYGLVYAFVLTRGQPWRERAFPIGLAIMLTGGMFAAVFTT